jgi:hypothetical protein
LLTLAESQIALSALGSITPLTAEVTSMTTPHDAGGKGHRTSALDRFSFWVLREEMRDLGRLRLD